MVVGLVSEALARLLQQEGGAVQVWLTGGDAECLLPLMPAGTIYSQDLVLDGLAFCEYWQD